MAWLSKDGFFILRMPVQTFVLVAFILNIGKISRADTPKITRQIETIIVEIGKKYCPDQRVAVWEIGIDSQDKNYSLNGETDHPEAVLALITQIKQTLPAIGIQNQIRILPDETVNGKNFGIVINSVEPLRSGPSVFNDMVTQTLRGLTVEILKSAGGCFLVRTDDGYLGWMEDDRLVVGSDSLKTAWENSYKVVYDDIEGIIYSKSDGKSMPVADVVLGNRFKMIGKQGQWTCVEIPDGRQGFISSQQLVSESEYLARTPTEDKIVATARNLLGRPYLWGANSPKAFDCSGFTQAVYRRNGYLLLRDANMQVNQGVAVDTTNLPENLRPGDLLFFGPNPEQINHVAIYLGNYEYIHCSAWVRINSLKPGTANYDDYLVKNLRYVRRIIGK